MKNNKKGFSLIELSIVLIIIGLLIAGVTSGASLINSAKIHRVTTEFTGLKQEVLLLKLEKDRLPGDLNDFGKTGKNSGNSYTASSFGYPYDGTTYKIPDLYSGPFVDLFLSGVSDFKPTCSAADCLKNSKYPQSKSFEEISYFFEWKGGATDWCLSGEQNINVITGDLKGGLHAKTMKAIDQKIDDGVINTGLVRGCGWINATYDLLIKLNKKISWFFYFYEK